MNIEKLYDNFLKFEVENDLFNLKINNIYFWKLIRFSIYQELVQNLGYITNKSITNKINYFLKIKKIYNIVNNSIKYSTFDDTRYKDIIILENPRKFKKNSEYYDPYTKYYIDKLLQNNSNLEIIDDDFSSNQFKKYDTIRKSGKSIFFDIFYRIKQKIIPLKFSRTEEKIIKDIEQSYYEYFDMHISLHKFIINNINLFTYQYHKWNKLFKIKNPKKFYLVCSYGKEGMIQAAKDNAIEVNEFQHGTITNFHVGYSFPSSVQIPYFPDKMLLFGKYWFDSTPLLPLKKDKIEYIGFQDLINKKKSYNNIKKEENRVLVISQWTLGEKLSRKTVELAKEHKNMKFIYRLHPLEKNNWKNNYNYLYKNINLPNLEVDEGIEAIYFQLAKCNYVLGIYSTAIYEALYYKCKVIIFNEYGAEYMQYCINNNYVMLMDINQKIDFSNINLKNYQIHYFMGK